MGKLYTIKHGDTLSQIALDNYTSEDEIMRHNPKIINPHEIKAEDVIVLPTMEDNRLPDGTFIGRRIDWTPLGCVVQPCQQAINNQEKEEISQKLKENIIFIGSEEWYDSFWLKMMFMAPGFSMGDGRLKKLRKAEKNTVAFVDVGYTKLEKLPIELLKNKLNINVITINSSDDIIKYMNNRSETQQDNETKKCLLQDVIFFCHGLPGKIALNYNGTKDISLSESNFSSINKDVFLEDGRIYSYACRTGIGTALDLRFREKFESDKDAHPEESLAQKMADHFSIEVYAYLTRTWYGDVLRLESDSERISVALKKARKTQSGVIAIPQEHECLPHKGLANKGSWLHGPIKEGTNEYALWRKKGARIMPYGHTTPKGLSKHMVCFKKR